MSMIPLKDEKDWMREFLPALDAALNCPDVSPNETIELYFGKIIDYERLTAASILCRECRQLGKPDRKIHGLTARKGLWIHWIKASTEKPVPINCNAWEFWESWEITLKREEGE